VAAFVEKIEVVVREQGYIVANERRFGAGEIGAHGWSSL